MSDIQIQLPVQIGCPHLQQSKRDLAELLLVSDLSHTSFKCFSCQQEFQLIICMDCLDVFCARHRASHIHQARYLIISRNSFWCADCSYLQIISNIKSHNYKKIVFLTGAGLSVAAGIPDFRTPGTGLYYQLSKYNLPSPQHVFDLQYFSQNPLPFIKLTKQWSNANFSPTKAHKFIKYCSDQSMLSCCITQNIDGLQQKVGIPEQLLIQAHGTSKTVSCIQCKLPGNLQEWNQAVQNQQPVLCQNCCGYIKANITFFGESLPIKFFRSYELVSSADLVFVVGTSLKVQPFCRLVDQISEGVPVILINNIDSLPHLSQKVWLKRNIQQQIESICRDLGWNLQ